jgi:hypothetical protein
VCAIAVSDAAVSDARTARPYDFDGDRRQELVVGMPSFSRTSMEAVGAVLVVEPGRRGRGTRTRLSHLTLGLPTTTAEEDFLGSSVASGDFDGDGFADLAVLGAGYGGDGGLYAIPGSAQGLRPSAVMRLPAAGVLIPQDPLVAGDLNRDGFDDLVVGMGLDGWDERRSRAGTIRIFFGGAAGLGDVDPRRILPPQRPSEFAVFPTILALGDVNGDRHLDIVEAAQGNPSVSGGSSGSKGHRSFCPGGPTGPQRCRALRTQDRVGPTSVAIGDVTGDGIADVVEGLPVRRFFDEDADERPASGAIRILRGTRRGPAKRPLVIERGTDGIPGIRRREDLFGTSVSVGAVDGDRFADIVAGAGDETVTLIRGGPSGHAQSGHAIYDQDTAGVGGVRRSGRGFGGSVALLAFDRGQRLDLAVGARGESVPPASVFVLPGARNGFTGISSTTITGRSAGVPDPGEGAIPAGSEPFGAVVGRSGSSR